MKATIPSLNGLRALSILFVLFGHVQINNFKHTDAPGAQIGVNIFFIISGFLITYLLLNEERNRGTISLKRFYFRRTIRIFPVYYSLLLVYFILQLLHILHFSTESWITSLTYTKYFHASDMETEHFWSLSVEEHFYLIWPMFFYFFKKYRVHFAVLVIVISPMIRLLTNLSIQHLFTRADSLMLGCLFAIYYDEILQFLRQRSKIFRLLPFFILVVCLASKRIDTLYYSQFPMIRHILIAFAGSYGTLTNLCVGLIIIISINFSGTWWYRLLNLKIADYIGVLSYSIYIWQQIFFSDKVGIFSKFAYNIGFIFIAAFLSYNLIELPFLRLKNKFQVSSRNVKLLEPVESHYYKQGT